MGVSVRRSTLRDDVAAHAAKLVSVAAGRAEVDVSNDPRVPRGKPRPTGGPKLEDSFVFERVARRSGSRLTVTARNVAPHARWTVTGTSAHPIRPVRARALRFESGGLVYIRQSVYHPGNAASSWWDDVLADHWPKALRSASSLL